MAKKLKSGLVYALMAFALLAAMLNGVAAVVSARRGLLTIGALYLLITIAISSAVLLGWYCLKRQEPYRWRNEGEGS
jgi:Mn2+/Fe2+ NRAMP family transporter